MPLNTSELTLIEQRVTNDGPSTPVAYLLWFFLGLLSAHRFYLGRPASAILQILSYFVLIGFFWLLLDLLLIPDMVRQKRDVMRQRLTTEMEGGQQLAFA
ncbi:TM2 domain-containing protein [Stakelama sediminis]|uniref:TM2 domain-containing membrane protein YozV n=1 Tax=Stakelama sediminis TaxID=463200 RepID=A0A840YW54_9SPHN|nr:TM2 domain-containing protein [Stakelama sediminis]MBB5717790.1 TM2 domain-containing membrane protein YozV [Stakelama sediminis]